MTPVEHDPFDELMIEPPDEGFRLELVPEAAVVPQIVDAPPPPSAAPAPVAAVLEPGFPLQTLLTFLPDVRLKQRVEAAAAEALAVDVSSPAGLQLADERLGDVRDAIRATEECFDHPVSIANQLHKRMTGLRADFTASGKAALDTVGRRVVVEQRRREAVEAEHKRKAQEAADRDAREAARRAAEAAARTHAPQPVVAVLQHRAEHATAPPVPSIPAAPLRRGTVTAKWRCRWQGTPAEEPANPKVAELSPQQQEQFRRLCARIADGTAPLACVEINWSYLNGRAADEKTTFTIPELEAYDEGTLRSKGTRR